MSKGDFTRCIFTDKVCYTLSGNLDVRPYDRGATTLPFTTVLLIPQTLMGGYWMLAGHDKGDRHSLTAVTSHPRAGKHTSALPGSISCRQYLWIGVSDVLF